MGAWLYTQFLLIRTKHLDGEKIDEVWKAFQDAFDADDPDEMDKCGRELIYNTRVSQRQLKEARKMINNRMEEFPELGELGLLAFSRSNGQ